MRTILLVLALALLPATAFAQRTPRQVVVAQLDTMTATGRTKGFTVASGVLQGGTIMGLLPKGSYMILELNLQPGREYFIGAGCDNDCEDLDLRAYAPDQKTVVGEDVEKDDVPIVTFRSRSGGPHLLSVMMSKCSTETCYFGVRVLTR